MKTPRNALHPAQCVQADFDAAVVVWSGQILIQVSPKIIVGRCAVNPKEALARPSDAREPRHAVAEHHSIDRQRVEELIREHDAVNPLRQRFSEVNWYVTVLSEKRSHFCASSAQFDHL